MASCMMVKIKNTFQAELSSFEVIWNMIAVKHYFWKDCQRQVHGFQFVFGTTIFSHLPASPYPGQTRSRKIGRCDSYPRLSKGSSQIHGLSQIVDRACLAQAGHLAWSICDVVRDCAAPSWLEDSSLRVRYSQAAPICLKDLERSERYCGHVRAPLTHLKAVKQLRLLHLGFHPLKLGGR